MKFGSFPISAADGVILAHTYRRAGLILKKGHVIGPEDIEALVKSGAVEIIGALLEPGALRPALRGVVCNYRTPARGAVTWTPLLMASSPLMLPPLQRLI